MKRQIKIIGTMIAIVLFMFLFTQIPVRILEWTFAIIIGVVVLFIFYAGVASYFEEED